MHKEIKEVIFNISNCKLRGYKLSCFQQGIKQTGIKQGLAVHLITFYELNQQTNIQWCVICPL